jgi:hypothetical protein
MRFGSIERFSPSTSSKNTLERSWLLRPPLFWVLAYHFLHVAYLIGGDAKPSIRYHAAHERIFKNMA